MTAKSPRFVIVCRGWYVIEGKALSRSPELAVRLTQRQALLTGANLFQDGFLYSDWEIVSVNDLPAGSE
jgi:hypothetical protein